MSEKRAYDWWTWTDQPAHDSIVHITNKKTILYVFKQKLNIHRIVQQNIYLIEMNKN